jgi:hypothetical protein
MLLFEAMLALHALELHLEPWQSIAQGAIGIHSPPV